MSLLGVYLAGCALLVVAGLAKAWRPETTARALAGAHPRLGGRPLAVAVRTAAAAEAALGLVAAAWPRPPAATAVAASYAAFTGYVLWTRHRGGVLATCGCFATPDTPATALHAVVDAAVAVAAAVVAARPPGPDLPAVLGAQPAAGVPLVAGTAVAAWLGFLVLSALPRLQAARRPPAGGAR